MVLGERRSTGSDKARCDPASGVLFVITGESKTRVEKLEKEGLTSCAC
jgi:hypothetical protein